MTTNREIEGLTITLSPDEYPRRTDEMDPGLNDSEIAMLKAVSEDTRVRIERPKSGIDLKIDTDDGNLLVLRGKDPNQESEEFWEKRAETRAKQIFKILEPDLDELEQRIQDAFPSISGVKEIEITSEELASKRIILEARNEREKVFWDKVLGMLRQKAREIEKRHVNRFRPDEGAHRLSMLAGEGTPEKESKYCIEISKRDSWITFRVEEDYLS